MISIDATIFIYFFISVAPDDLLELSGLFGVSLVESALALIDSEKVKIYRSQSRSGEFIEIPGHNGIVYKLFPNINHCRCQTFNEQVLQFKSQYTCKHILAAKLAVHLGKEKVEIIADDLFNFLIQQIGVE